MKLLSRGCEITTILSLTRYTLTSVCIFSILFSIYFLSCWQGEFVWQSRASLVGDHFVYSCDLHVWFRGDIVGRNKTLVTLRGKKVNEKSILLSIGHFKLTELFLFLSSAYDQTVNILSRKYGLEDCTSWQHTTAVFAPFLLEQIRNITITHEIYLTILCSVCYKFLVSWALRIWC